MRSTMVDEHARGAGVGEEVGIALANVLPGEGPVLQRGASVVVVYERHRTGRPQAHHTRGAALHKHHATGRGARQRLLNIRLRHTSPPPAVYNYHWCTSIARKWRAQQGRVVAFKKRLREFRGVFEGGGGHVDGGSVIGSPAHRRRWCRRWSRTSSRCAGGGRPEKHITEQPEQPETRQRARGESGPQAGARPPPPPVHGHKYIYIYIYTGPRQEWSGGGQKAGAPDLRGGGGGRGGAGRRKRKKTQIKGFAHLVVGEHAVGVVARVPELSDGEAGHGGVDVLLRVLARVPQHKVKAEAVDAYGVPQPPHPLLELLAHRLVGVVDVGRRRVCARARPRIALAAPLRHTKPGADTTINAGHASRVPHSALHVTISPALAPCVTAYARESPLTLRKALGGDCGAGRASGSPLCGAGRLVVAGDHLLVPGHAPAELVPAALRILRGAAAVVDHDVRARLEVARAQLRIELNELRLRAVLGVEVVEVCGEVALVRDGRGGRRQPDGREAGVCQLVDAADQVLVPTHPVHPVARLPVEALQQNLVALPTPGPGAH
eukprot:1188794-Prorocentrum_minimum.AAC.1